MTDFDRYVMMYCQQRHITRKEAEEHRNLVVNIPDNGRAQEEIKKIQETIVGLNTLLRMYNRYMTEENYKAVLYAITQVGIEIGDIGFKLKNAGYKMIEK